MSYFVRTKFSGYTQDGLRQLCKGGGGGSSTNTTINYSPEEAARRALDNFSLVSSLCL